jgi:hypothetical protein
MTFLTVPLGGIMSISPKTLGYLDALESD